jgi:hypothetical protein
MRRFVLGWKKLGHEKRWKAYIVNYADDLVICCRGNAEEALATMRNMMTKLKLTVNEKKTRVCKLPEEKFDFLGYTFGRCYSMRRGRAFLGTVPSKKRVQRSRVRRLARQNPGGMTFPGNRSARQLPVLAVTRSILLPTILSLPSS